MAEEVKIIIDVEGGKGAQTVKDMGKDLQKAAESGDKVTNAIKNTGTVTVDVRQKLRELQNKMAEIGDVGSAEFQQLAAEAGKYKDQMNNANAAIKAMSADFPRLQVGVQALQAMGAAAQTAMSVQALLGTENEEVTKTIQKMVAVQGVMNGLQSISNLLSDESAIGLKLRTIRTNLFTRATVAQAVATGTASKAQMLMNVIMNLNPIGLIVTGVLLLIAGMVLLATKVKAVGNFFVTLGAKLHDVINWLGSMKYIVLALLGPIGLLIAAWDYFYGESAKNLDEQQKAEEAERKRKAEAHKEISRQHTERLNAIKAERKALEEKHSQMQGEFDLEIKINGLLGKSTDELTTKKLENNLQWAEDQKRITLEALESWTKYYNDLFVMSGKSMEDFKAQLKGQGIDIDLLEQERINIIKDADDQIRLSSAELTSFKIKGSKKVKDAAVKDTKESLDIIEKLENDYLDSKLSKQTQEENAVRDKYFAAIELAKENGIETNLLEEAQLQELTDIRVKFELQEQEVLAAIQQERDDAELKRKKDLEDKKQKLVEDTFASAENLLSIAQSVNTIFHGNDLKRINEKKARGEQLTKAEIKRLEREEKVQKAFALVQVAIDTAKAISGAVAVGASSGPFPYNLAAIISGVAAALSGVAQASQILGSGSSVSAGGGGGGSASIEDSAGSASQTAPINTITEGSTLLNQQPSQVVVVESITEGIKSVGVIEAQATF
tara:strand:+ start:12057 stop:14231 length:2175 start_codon:yes stop_codon:yes gene_type:complete